MNRYGYAQVATYWANPVPDGFGGHTYDAPRAIVCRWEERRERFTDQNGDEHTSKAVVYVREDLDLGGYLYLGEISDPDQLPELTTGAHRIQEVKRIPDLRNVVQERRVYL